MKSYSSITAMLLWVSLQLLPATAQACAVCFGEGDSPIGKAANGAIGVMLILIGSVLGCFIFFMFHLARQSRKAALSGVIGGEATAATTSQSSQKLH